MKKVVCMLITSVMVVSTLSGCFGDSEQEKLARRINEAQEKKGAAGKEAMKKFQAHIAEQQAKEAAEKPAK